MYEIYGILVAFIILLWLLFYYWPFHKYLVALMLNNATAGLVFNDASGKIILQVGDVKQTNTASITVLDESKFWTRLLFDSDVGLGETYVDGVWNSPDITAFLYNLYFNFRTNSGDETVWTRGFSKLLNMNKLVCSSAEKDKERIQGHYDIGNDFYDLFLKESALKAYTCAFFTSEECTLDEAQKNKVDLIIKKMNVKPGAKILDIGCGWGHIANYVSEKTGAHVVGLSISEEQIKYINKTFDTQHVSVINRDWRELLSPEYHQHFDAVYSIGMFEHVRYENAADYLKMVANVLKPEGRAVIHSIVSPTNTPKQMVENGTFITKHIFPGGQIPMHDWITDTAIQIPEIKLSHSECFGGHHYARTCREWRQMLLNERDYVLQKYDDKLLKKYDYYLASCDAAFSVGLMALGHFVFVKTPRNTFNNQYFPL